MCSYQCTKVIPDLRNVRIQSDCAGVGIEGVSVLVDLVIKHTNGAPEGRISSIAVNCLLICFVRLGVFLLGHVTTAKEVPALSIGIVWIGSGRLMTGECGAVVVVPEPTDFSKYSMASS